MPGLFRHANQDIRTLLISLGVDPYNASALITTTFSSPSTTDLNMQAVILMIKALQGTLRTMGATDVYPTGQLDLETASAIAQITGPGWKSAPWYMTIQAVAFAADHGRRVSPMRRAAPSYAVPMSGFALPSIPGGPLGWLAIGAGVLYYYTHKR